MLWADKCVRQIKNRCAGVMDSGTFRVKDYPYLRTNRFLASFREAAMNRETFATWVNHMQALDQEARGYEIANLPADAPTPVSANYRDELKGNVVTCGDLLKAADFQDANLRIEALRKEVNVPDEYSLLHRALGFYPLFRVFVSMGVDIWHAEAIKSFSTKPPADWSTTRYVPEKFVKLPTSRQIAQKTRQDALGIPAYASKDLQALFRIYAPVWEVQTQADHDRLGAPFWTREGELCFNPGQPLTYTLLYETIHNCGCFYKAFPAKGLKVREKIDYAESPLILQTPEVSPDSEFMTVAMKSRTHAVQHLFPLTRETQSESAVYSLADYGQLRSLPRENDMRASMFDQNGVGIGSERLERFILWPTGVLSPGSMRQWGRQAVAFVGTRHFDRAVRITPSQVKLRTWGNSLGNPNQHRR